MKIRKRKNILFYDYFKEWVKLYKYGSIRDRTMEKYKSSMHWINKLAPNLRLRDIDRSTYQQILNEYAIYHEKVTTMDFHHHLRSCILDAVDEQLLNIDPTRKAIIKGKTPKKKKPKYISQFQLQNLINDLHLDNDISWDWLILLISKTGLRFSEALGVTPKDFDFQHQTLNIDKTWDYKSHQNTFQPTKNHSSIRKVQLDWQTCSQFAMLIQDKDENIPIFCNGHVNNSTVNYCLKKHCLNSNIPVITIHGLRHTHASLLLFAGVSVASVSRRLGHSSINTTERVYLHVIQELESSDNNIIMKYLSGLQ